MLAIHLIRRLCMKLLTIVSNINYGVIIGYRVRLKQGRHVKKAELFKTMTSSSMKFSRLTLNKHSDEVRLSWARY